MDGGDITHTNNKRNKLGNQYTNRVEDQDRNREREDNRKRNKREKKMKLSVGQRTSEDLQLGTEESLQSVSAPSDV